ncbi:hypothetical protein AB3S75_037485 [Citrus x aurantiifolia]
MTHTFLFSFHFGPHVNSTPLSLLLILSPRVNCFVNCLTRSSSSQEKGNDISMSSSSQAITSTQLEAEFPLTPLPLSLCFSSHFSSSFTRSSSPLSLRFSSHSSSTFVSVFHLAPAAASSPSPLSLATTPDLLGGRCLLVLLAGPRLPRLSPSHSLRLVCNYFLIINFL